MPTLLDIAKLNGSDAVVGLIEEVVKVTPEVRVGEARTIRGFHYKTSVRTALPVVGFRNANEGATSSASTFEERLVEAYTFNPRWTADKAVADAHEDGAAAYLAIEAAGIMQASAIALGTQFYYGSDAKGFAGLQSLVDSSMTMDAGGTTASTGSSVYAVKFGPQNVQWIIGGDGKFEMEDARVADLADANDNLYTAYIQELLVRIGLQFGSKYSVARMKDITADSGKTLDDDKLAELISLFPVGIVPDALFMTRRSRMQLQQSRTATTTNGAAVPLPVEYEGIPILATDSLLNTETLS